ncbi:MAG TPA: peptidoglycan DD-metalloendopeptidase family protein [Myxococcaceae bacterium]|nr:peptidoglycan DD-metalloendopeptidase family protein [Myxococcaceae bacterium]
MRPAAALLGVVLLGTGAAAAEAPAEWDPLETQRALVRAIRAQSGNAEAAFAVYAGLARVSAARAAALSAQMRVLASRLAAAEAEEALARAVLDSRVDGFRPRLLSLYRLTRRSPLEVLLPAEDVAAFAWRARALSSLVRSDLAALEEMRSVALFQRSRLEQLDAWKRQMGSRLAELRAEAEEAAGQETELGEALQLLQARARAAGSVLAELGRSRAQLQALAAVLEEPEPTGFGALRGKLPLPAPGHVEVAFGRLVHPKFNTVTVQKGLDIRAVPGAPARALAPATVAWTGWLGGYGNLVVLDQGDGYHTIYAHLAEVLRPVGTHVFPGEVVGTVGDTGSLKGAYLYFEVRRRGLAVDPMPWVGAAMARAP